MDNSHRSANEDSMRRAIFALLNAHKVSPDTALKALAQCQSHVRNRVTIEEMVRACGMTTSGFLSNEHLELYYDLKQGRHAVGYVSKGWDDPGFRIGEIVEVPKWHMADMEEQVYALIRSCTVQGVTVTIEENDASIGLQMDAVVYSEGMNRTVFEQVVHHVQRCVEKAHELIA